MKVNCIIDTCSCIYLSNAEFRQKSLLKYLFDTATLNYSKEVSLEIRDHADKGLPPFIQKESLKVSTLKYSINEYERRMLGKVLVSRHKGGNKGEIDNFLLSVDQLHHIKKNSTIFITDDEKALNGNLLGWLDSFPAIKVWTSYEVILFLYAEKIIPSKDIAVDLVRQIIYFTAPKLADRSQDTTNKLTRLLALYNKRIDNIATLLN